MSHQGSLSPCICLTWFNSHLRKQKDNFDCVLSESYIPSDSNISPWGIISMMSVLIAPLFPILSSLHALSLPPGCSDPWVVFASSSSPAGPSTADLPASSAVLSPSASFTLTEAFFCGPKKAEFLVHQVRRASWRKRKQHPE